MIYGAHPYGRDPRGTLRELAAISLDDVKLHHARHFLSDRAFLVVVGDFEPKELRALIESRLSGWQASSSPADAIAQPTSATRPRRRRVRHAGEQVHIVMGHLGIQRRHPDFDALVVLDHILGSGPGFTDRLSRTLRDEMGLAYSVGGGMTDSADVAAGCFRVYLGTGPAEARRAISEATHQIEAIHRGAFSDEEVECARRYLAGSWVFDFQTTAQRADRLLELERWELPLDEPVRWPERIERVSATAVRRAARTHLNPAALVHVEYGPIDGKGS
jgi:zinc protease